MFSKTAKLKVKLKTIASSGKKETEEVARREDGPARNDNETAGVECRADMLVEVKAFCKPSTAPTKNANKIRLPLGEPIAKRTLG